MTTLHVARDVRDLNETQRRERRDHGARRAAEPRAKAAAKNVKKTKPEEHPTPKVLAACRRLNSGFYDHPEVIDAVVERVLKALSRE